jgi:hypothetical protein
MPKDTARSNSSRRSRARGESLLDLLETIPPSPSPYVELAPLATEEPASDQPILNNATVADLLGYEQRIIDMQEALRWKSINDKLLERLERLRPCPWGSVPGAL